MTEMFSLFDYSCTNYILLKQEPFDSTQYIYIYIYIYIYVQN